MQLLISCCLIYLFNQGWSLFSHTLLRCSSIIWLAANNPSYRDACVLNSLILFLFSSGIQQSSISRPLHLKFRELLTDIATFDQKNKSSVCDSSVCRRTLWAWTEPYSLQQLWRETTNWHTSSKFSFTVYLLLFTCLSICRIKTVPSVCREMALENLELKSYLML